MGLFNRRYSSSPEKGLAIIEFALVITPLLIFAFEMFDVSNILHHHAVLTQLARESVRSAGQRNITNIVLLRSSIQTQINLSLDGASGAAWGARLNFVPASVIVTAGYPVIAGGNITVRIEGRYDGMFFPWRNFALSAEATGPVL